MAILWGSTSTPTLAAARSLGTNISTSDGTVYTITQESNITVRRPYTSAGAFLSFGFNNWGNVLPATADDLALPVGTYIPPRDGSIICSDRGADKGTCYLITENKRAGFTSAEIFNKLGFNFNTTLSGDVSFLNASTNIDSDLQAHRPGTLVNKDGTVYFVSPTGLLGIPDWASLLSWGYSQQDIVPANTADRSAIVTGNLTARQPGQISPISSNTTPLTPSPTIGLVFTTPLMIDGKANDDYSFQFKVSGGTAPYKFELSHTTHPCCYVKINTTSGVFSNTSSNLTPKAGNWDVWVKVTDSNGKTIQQVFLWRVLPDYDQPFSADISSQTKVSDDLVKLAVKIVLEDETVLANETINVDGYGSYLTDGNGMFTINALYGATIKIRFNGRSYNLKVPAKPIILPPPPPCSGTCA